MTLNMLPPSVANVVLPLTLIPAFFERQFLLGNLEGDAVGGPFFWVLGRNFRWGKKCPGGDYLGGFFPTAGGLPTAPAFALVQAPALGSIFGRGIQILIQVLCVCAKEGGIFHNFPFDPSAPHKSNNLTPRRTRPWMQKKKHRQREKGGTEQL